MRLFPSLFFASLLFLAAPAWAERVIEVRNIRVEQTGANGRDAAITEATRQAALGVWHQMGKTTDLPTLSPTQIQSLASYVDIANEQTQAGYYAATFTIGVRSQVLSKLTGETVSTEAFASPAPAAPSTSATDSMAAAVPASPKAASLPSPVATQKIAPPLTANTVLNVRLPLKQASDLAVYKTKISLIPGARFELTALGQRFVEGLISYPGSRDVLLRELATQGLAQNAR